MNSIEHIRAQLELPCTVRAHGSRQRLAKGITQELARDSVVVLVENDWVEGWLRPMANVIVAVELRSEGYFHPRNLEFASIVSRIDIHGDMLRVIAEVRRMKFLDRQVCGFGKVN